MVEIRNQKTHPRFSDSTYIQSEVCAKSGPTEKPRLNARWGGFRHQYKNLFVINDTDE